MCTKYVFTYKRTKGIQSIRHLIQTEILLFASVDEDQSVQRAV